MVGILALKTAPFLFNGDDVPSQRFELYFLGPACNELLPVSHSYVGRSTITPSAFYGAAFSTLRRLRALPTTLDTLAASPMRLVEVLKPDAVPAHRRQATPQYFCTAMAPVSFPGQLREFQ